MDNVICSENSRGIRTGLGLFKYRRMREVIMKLKNILFVMLIAVFGVMNAHLAQAATQLSTTNIQIIGSDPSEYGLMTIGQSGTYNFDGLQYFGDGNVAYEVATKIPENSMITFTYNSTGFIPGEGKGFIYVYDPVGNQAYSTAPIEPGGLTSVESSTAYAYASAQFVNGNSNEGNFIIKNLTTNSINVLSYFQQLYSMGSTAGVTINYEVSAVPLPAALPMFGMGLLAVAGLRRRKAVAAAA